MPRYDKPGFFRENEGEDKLDSKTPEEGEASNIKKSTIDFSPYLREPKYTLKEVILPESTFLQINYILDELKYQELIYAEWGMAEKHKLDKALSVNFAGLPGTGKTITAEALAHSLNLKILDVPYQLLESKFVGETPKNIASAFDFASKYQAVLFFDEADSFLGRRLESVTQSTDTAVNLTRSVMLKQLSEYAGIVVFATNLIRNYDPAFISRIRWKVQFGLPDEDARAKVWQIQIPGKLPLCDSVSFSELAKDFDGVSGRDIKNAVFQAVVSAAREDKPKECKRVTHAHLVDAITQVVEANKAAAPSGLKLNPAEGEISLPSRQ